MRPVRRRRRCEGEARRRAAAFEASAGRRSAREPGGRCEPGENAAPSATAHAKVRTRQSVGISSATGIGSCGSTARSRVSHLAEHHADRADAANSTTASVRSWRTAVRVPHRREPHRDLALSGGRARESMPATLTHATSSTRPTIAHQQPDEPGDRADLPGTRDVAATVKFLPRFSCG